jgi:4-amino-4-deoxy-L-arabinose transferase-like glycosyltransferase
MSKKCAVFLILVVFLFVFALRWVNLGSDPPKDLSTSMGYYSDPGGYAHNARNKILFGQWETDKWNHMYTSPIPHYTTYLIFLLFGVGIAQMNAVPALFSCLLLLVLFFALRRSWTSMFALLGIFLLGSNYIFTMSSQVAARAIPMLFFVGLGLVFLLVKEKPPRYFLFLAGGMSFLAFATKGTFLLVLPALVLGIACHGFFQGLHKIKRPLRDVSLFGMGMASVMALWLWLIYFPQLETFQAFGGSNFFWLTHGWEKPLETFWYRPLFYFMDMPVLTCLASLTLLALAYKGLTDPKKISLLSWVCGFWIVSNMVYTSIIYYRAARHLVPLIVPLVLLAVQGLFDLSRRSSLGRPRKRPFLFFIFAFFWFIFAWSGLIILFSRPVNAASRVSSSYLVLALSLISCTLLYLVFRLWPQNLSLPLPAAFKTAVIAFLVMLSFGFNFRSYLKWGLSPRYDRKIISQDLGEAFQDARLGGLVSMVLALENTHPAHAYKTDYINRGLDFLDRYKITHLLLTTHAEEIPDYRNDFPQAMQQAVILARYPLWQTYVVLYDLFPRQPPEEKGEVLEGEVFFGENGLPRYDPAASGRMAYAIERHPRGAHLALPLGLYPAGRYRLVYRLKAEKLLQEESRLARIDVATRDRQRALAQRDLASREFKGSEKYQDFELEFRLRSPREISLRLYSTGKTPLRFDSVTLSKTENIE